MVKTRSISFHRILITFVITILVLTACAFQNRTKPVQKGQESTGVTETSIETGEKPEDGSSATKAPSEGYATPEGTRIGRVDCQYNEFGTRQPIAFSADGQQLACYKNLTLMLYQVNPLKLYWEVSLGGESVNITFSPDGAYLGVISENDNGQDTLDLYDTKNGEYLKGINIPEVYSYLSIAFSPNSQFIAVENLRRGGYEGYTILDWKSDEIIQTIDLYNRDGAIFSADGKRFINANSGKTRIYDTTSWEEIPLEIDYQWIKAETIGMAANGTWVYQLGGIATLVKDDKPVYQYKNLVNNLSRDYAISTDGKWYASQGAEAITICNLTTGEQIDYSRLAEGHIIRISFTPQETLVGVSNRGGYVELWEYDFKQ